MLQPRGCSSTVRKQRLPRRPLRPRSFYPNLISSNASCHELVPSLAWIDALESGRAVTRPLSNQFARHVVPKLDLPCRAANQTFSRKKSRLTAPEAPSTSKSPLRCRVVKTSDTGSEWRALCNLATPEGEAELSRPCRLLSEGDADTFVTHRGLV
jgi:hypothetical protein